MIVIRPAASLLSLAAALAIACTAAKPSSRAADTASPATAAPAAAATSTSDGALAPRGIAATHDSVTDRADKGRIMGDPRATVWLIEASDFQCPYCKTWHDSTYPAVLRDYVKTGKVRIAYLNHPLNIHSNAMPAAEAAMCASVQGRFWEMHDALFGTQAQWAPSPDPTASFVTLAGKAGVDTAAFRRCLATHATRALVDADVERTSRAGVESTPNFFVGDQLVKGAQPYGVFRQAIEAALAKAPGAPSR